MAKLSFEKKAEIVMYYLNTNDGYKNTAHHFGILHSVVEMMVAQYNTNGIEGLKLKNGTYSGEFKLHVLQYQQQYKLSDKETAVHFQIPHKGIICTWRKKYLQGGYELLCRDGRGNPKNMTAKKSKKNIEPKTELEKLRDEVEWLRMENAILKKITCLNSGRREIRTRDKARIIGELRQKVSLQMLLKYF